jgi:hypothetical protein
MPEPFWCGELMMKMRFLATAAIFAAVSFAPVSAATFTAEHGVEPTACNTAVTIGPFTTGQVIAYTAQDCQGGYNVFLDTTAQTITFVSAEAPFADYRFSEFSITGITETTITSLSAVSTAGLFNTASNPAPSIALSFTGSSINILFGTRSSTTPIFDFATDGVGQAVFSYNSAVVPEPANWAMLIAGFGLVGAAARRRRAITAA